MPNDLNRYSAKENISLANWYIKTCSTSLVIREIQNKPQWDITIYPLEWLNLKRLIILCVDKDVERLELFCITGGRGRWQPFWKTIWQSLIKLSISTVWPSYHTLVFPRSSVGKESTCSAGICLLKAREMRVSRRAPRKTSRVLLQRVSRP